MPTLLDLTQRLAIAALIGLAVGIERERSSPTAPAERRFAGLRTFLLLGLLGGTTGLLFTTGYPAPATVLLAAGAAFIVVAYALAIRRPEHRLDGTTEAAALVVLGLSLLAGLGYIVIAAGAVTLAVVALAEKTRLHGWVRKIDQVEMRAGLQFMVLALVVLPLLPSGPYEGFFNFRPRALWGIVLLISGLNFAGYIARQVVGPQRGYAVTGLLGGVLSSTAVTFQFSRLSRIETGHRAGLGIGVIGACTILPIRVLVVSTALDRELALQAAAYMVPLLLMGALLLTIGFRRASDGGAPAATEHSPLRLGSALQMALLLQGALILFEATAHLWGNAGFYTTAAIVGATDADALTVAMSRMVQSGTPAPVAAQGIAVGIAASTVFKLVIAQILGIGAFRRWTFAGLALMLGVLAATLVL
ncbi:MAG TPA: DUF4010 domain-containing protein [Gemmatimonadales bacterium]|nr:DUF4010 domain-containing protein [Gemmatimonadales bacterium]